MAEKKGKERYRRTQKRKHKNFKFSDKVHPKKGILSFVFGILGMLTLFITSYLSFRAKGNAGMIIGLAGFIAFMLSIAGVVLAILALRQKDIHYRFPVMGGILCGMLLLGYFVMYTLGAIL